GCVSPFFVCHGLRSPGGRSPVLFCHGLRSPGGRSPVLFCHGLRSPGGRSPPPRLSHGFRCGRPPSNGRPSGFGGAPASGGAVRLASRRGGRSVHGRSPRG